MAIIQISKFRVRRGEEADLPTNLDEGEFGFATDTGRLFIGHSPSFGSPNYDREVFPYRNIEVLTEASIDKFKEMVGQIMRSLDNAAYANATLLTTTGANWRNLRENLEDGSTPLFQIQADSINATMEYSVFDSNNVALRHGVLRVTHPGDGTEPTTSDEAVVNARYELGGNDDYSPDSVYGSLRFAFVRVTVGASAYYRLQYQNKLGEALTFFYRYSRVAP